MSAGLGPAVRRAHSGRLRCTGTGTAWKSRAARSSVRSDTHSGRKAPLKPAKTRWSARRRDQLGDPRTSFPSGTLTPLPRTRTGVRGPAQLWAASAQYGPGGGGVLPVPCPPRFIFGGVTGPPCTLFLAAPAGLEGASAKRLGAALTFQPGALVCAQFLQRAGPRASAHGASPGDREHDGAAGPREGGVKVGAEAWWAELRAGRRLVGVAKGGGAGLRMGRALGVWRQTRRLQRKVCPESR